MVENEAAFEQFLVYAYKFCDEAILSEETAGADLVKAAQRGGPAAGGRSDGGAAVDGTADRSDALLVGLDLEAFAGKGRDVQRAKKAGGNGGGGGSAGASTSGVPVPHLEVSGWWLDHLAVKEREAGGSSSTSSDLTTLRWIFGKIASQLVGRGRACGGREPSSPFDTVWDS